jgi:predicted Rossmann fold nucleotide-binding protein DprA/Smf involved in DNA uptake
MLSAARRFLGRNRVQSGAFDGVVVPTQLPIDAGSLAVGCAETKGRPIGAEEDVPGPNLDEMISSRNLA